MIWRDAVDWAENLSYFDSVRNVTYDDWRLPTVQPIDGTGFDYDFSPAGNTDRGYNISAPGTAYTSSTGSELAYMFHVNLGNLSAYDTSGVFRGGASGTDWGVVNTGLFLNLQNFVYWSGTEYAPYTNLAWRFYAYDGLQYAYGKDFAYHAWAVRSGDVAAPPSIPELRSLVGITATPSIPEPGSLMLVGLGLVGLGWTRRRRFDHLGEFPLKG
ncbi:MAG: DUF1566 domain-containing protein [Gammaproteobacteria bacterium]|nr:DUF1566 domain-containing protein [Gammaproteobacteria bacterium]